MGKSAGKSLLRVSLAIGLAASIGACRNDDAVLGVTTPLPPGATLRLSRDVQPIFNRSCALSGCHAGTFPAEGMSLEAARIFDPMGGAVDVPSLEAPFLKRIDPSSSATSYLVAKLEGNQAIVGGSGSTMPLGAPPLFPVEIQVIRDWIDQGAQDN